MIGDKIKFVSDIYEAAVGKTGGKPCICVHGERASNKTKLIEGVKNTLLMSGANVFFAIGDNPATDGDYAIRELIRQLAGHFDGRYDPDFLQFAVSYSKGSLADDLGRNNVKPFEKDSLIKFIYDCAKAEPVVFIIDNLDRADDFTVKLIGNLLSVDVLQFLIFSHTDKLENTLLTQILYKNTKLIEYLQLKETAGGSTHRNPDIAALPDEAVITLSRAGMERELIHYYIKSAQDFIKALAYEKAFATLSDALRVCSKTAGEAELEIDLLIKLGDIKTSEKDYKAAETYYLRAYRSADNLELFEKCASASVKLAGCYKILGVPDKVCQHIMLSEAFFYKSQHRTGYYDLYSQHIPNYLSFLAEQGERVIFREKLKQALSVCRLDDTAFTCRLYCEEGYFCMDAGEYDAARKLFTDARELSSGNGACKIRDEATNSLAICCEHMGKSDFSAALWNEIISKSHDPVKTAGALVNLAIMQYELDNNADMARERIKTGIDLYTLSGEDILAAEVISNLTGTPLA